jgi:hypothetical protein
MSAQGMHDRCSCHSSSDASSVQSQVSSLNDREVCHNRKFGTFAPMLRTEGRIVGLSNADLLYFAHVVPVIGAWNTV